MADPVADTVDVQTVNSSGQTVTVRLSADSDLIAHLQRMAKKDDLVSAKVVKGKVKAAEVEPAVDAKG